jgi:hypothetical protein
MLAMTAGLYAQVNLTVSPTSSTLGQSVSLTATVPPTATGTVTFYDASTVLGITRIAAGQGVLTTSLLSAGSHSLRARYNGDAAHLAASSPSASQTVTALASYSFQAPVNSPAGDFNSCGAVADLNHDGKADVVFANSFGVDFALGNGDGSLQNKGVFLMDIRSASPNCLVVADFDGDGNPDVAVAASAGVQFLHGNGDGSFLPPVAAGPALAASVIAVGDFNGDGIIDLAIVNANDIFILRGAGDGSFTIAQDYPLPNLVNSLVVADFNGDGIADIAAALGGGSEIHSGVVLLGKGDGSFQTPLYFGTSFGILLVVADFDGDGHPDIDTGGSVFLAMATAHSVPPICPRPLDAVRTPPATSMATASRTLSALT